MSFSDEKHKALENAGFDVMSYDKRWDRIRIRLTPKSLEAHRDVLEAVIAETYSEAEK